MGFILPETVRGKISEIQSQIGALGMRAKFVEPENLHICLSFIGDSDPDEVAGKLEPVCSRYKGFTIRSDSISFIPNESYIRVIALNVHDSTGTLEKLRNEFKTIVGGDSHSPHITLCRVKSLEDKSSLVNKTKLVKVDIELDIDRLQLIKSELSRSGPVYTVAKEFNLR